jgi:hypothetical protein
VLGRGCHRSRAGARTYGARAGRLTRVARHRHHG